MFFTGNNSNGYCPALGGAHDPSRSGPYSIGNILSASSSGTPQSQWTWCVKCQGLFFSGNTLPDGQLWLGICPGDGLAHSTDGSGDYALAYGPTVFPVIVDHLLTWQSFATPLQDDCDHIEVATSDNAGGSGGSVYRLQAGPGVTFSKELKLLVPGRLDQTVAIDGAHPVSGDLVCPADALSSARLVLSKGKFLNIITGEYQLSSLLDTAGKLVVFHWVQERC